MSFWQGVPSPVRAGAYPPLGTGSFSEERWHILLSVDVKPDSSDDTNMGTEVPGEHAMAGMR